MLLETFFTRQPSAGWHKQAVIMLVMKGSWDKVGNFSRILSHESMLHMWF